MNNRSPFPRSNGDYLQPSSKLVRTSDDKVIAGVCGGIAKYLGVDAWIVRLVTAVLSLGTAGVVLTAYLVLWLVLPEDGTGRLGADTLYDKYGEFRQKSKETPKDTFRSDQ